MGKTSEFLNDCYTMYIVLSDADINVVACTPLKSSLMQTHRRQPAPITTLSMFSPVSSGDTKKKKQKIQAILSR
jgi:hypothetical protein